MSDEPLSVRIGNNYYYITEVQEIFKEWDDKVILWSSGIEQPTKADKLLFDILKDYTYLRSI